MLPHCFLLFDVPVLTALDGNLEVGAVRVRQAMVKNRQAFACLPLQVATEQCNRPSFGLTNLDRLLTELVANPRYSFV